jgi:dynein heavy chain
LSREISYNKRKTIRLDSFEVQCEQINKELFRRIEHLTNKLVAKTLSVNLEANKQICAEFDLISQKALTHPSNTAQLMEIKAFVEKAEKEAIPRLERAVYDARGRLEYLLENATLSRFLALHFLLSLSVLISFL